MRPASLWSAILAAIFLALSAPLVRAGESVDDMLRNMHPRDVRGSVQDPAACREAKIGIRWVLVEDRGARGTYEGGRNSGMPALDAVIWAQHHNPHAQQMIRECPSSAAMIAEIIGRDGMAGRGGAGQGGQAGNYPTDPASLDAMITPWQQPFSGNSVLVVLENRGNRDLYLEVIVTCHDNTPVSDCGEVYSGLLVRARGRESFVVSPFPDFDRPPKFDVKTIARLQP